VRHLRRHPHCYELVLIYFFGLIGGLLGAKLGYVFGSLMWVEGQMDINLLDILHGKTIVGALLGGYAGVEVGKAVAGYHQSTGDRFALIVPPAIALGRVGCILHRCCGGMSYTHIMPDGSRHAAQLPTAAIELSFQILIWGILLLLYRRSRCRDQLFHIYLIAYGLFRFALEPWRDTPKVYPDVMPPFSGYQILALGLVVLGVAQMIVRSRQQHRPGLPVAA